MPGPTAKQSRRRRNPPALGEWKATEGVGWQHGPLPEPPEGLMPASIEAWRAWMTSWFASHWAPADLPGLRHLVRLYDLCERGEHQRSAELRMTADTYGVTPRGQQMLRWKAPEDAPKSIDAPNRPSYAGVLKAVK